MDIAMLGVSNAGKTSYVTAMYGEMFRSQGPFSMAALRPADHTALVRNAARLSKGTYPPPSEKRSAYGFRLCFSAEPFFDFVWKDYRGGALTELAEKSSQAKQLRDDLAAAHGLVIMIDSTELRDRKVARRKIRPVVAAAINVLQDREEVTPLVIALTKWDLVEAVKGEVLDIAQEALGDLIQSAAQTQHIGGALIPVACGPSPLNVKLPVLFCISVAVVTYYLEVDAAVEAFDRAAAAAGARRDPFEDLAKWWRGQPTAAKEQAAHQRDASLLRAHLAPLVEPARELLAQFDNTYTF